MLGLKGFLLVMLKSAFIVAFLSIPKPVVAFAGLKGWPRKALYTKIDLCTQACYSQIIPGLYLNHARAAAETDVLSHLSITNELAIEAHWIPKHFFVGTNTENRRIRDLDPPETNLLSCFPISNAFVQDGLYSGDALVNQSGLSRSGVSDTAHLMQTYRMSLDDFRHIKYRKYFINPNPSYIAEMKDFGRPNYVVTGLYLSNARAAADRNVLARLGITHVLSIEAHKLPKSTFEGTNISTLFIRAYDLPQSHILPYFPMANAFINDGLKKGNVLVHCHFGVSRSATLVIAYLMAQYKMTFEQAFVYVRQRRRFINPNTGFVAQLREYQRLNYDVNGMHRLEAYMNVNARKHKYKIASAAAVLFGVIVPAMALI